VNHHTTRPGRARHQRARRAWAGRHHARDLRPTHPRSL